MMAVMQLSYISMLGLKDINPCFYALRNLMYVNGVSYYQFNNNDNKYLIDPYSPTQAKAIRLSSLYF